MPEGTRSLVLIVDDPDASIGTWDHWLVWNITPRERVDENSIPGNEGMNSFRRQSYGDPCPSEGTHRYFFKVYALDTMLALGSDSRKNDVETAIQGHVLAQGEIIGLYKRVK
jgi:Raf kinase inhibitor-like YbhB/YbcL family protein